MSDVDVLIGDRLQEIRARAGSSPLHVVAAIVRKPDGAVLISQRPKHKAQGGLWEFPGGKVEKGESRWGALCRELDEELAVTLHRGFPLVAFTHDYPDLSVFLDFWVIDDFTGDPRSCEGQLFAWAKPDELWQYQFPEANVPVLTSLSLPDGIWITPSADIGQWSGHLNHPVFQESCSGNTVAVQFRAPQLSAAEYVEAATTLSEDWPTIRWIWNADPSVWGDLPSGAFHLATRYLHTHEHGVRDHSRLLYAAVHNQSEYSLARHLRVDAMVVSPIHRTPSHAVAEPMGWEGFAALAVGSSTPMFALGGVGPNDLPIIRSMGGRGWAGIRWAGF